MRRARRGAPNFLQAAFAGGAGTHALLHACRLLRAARILAACERRLREPAFIARAVDHGRAGAQRLRSMISDVTERMQDPASIAATGECSALGWKPQ